MVGPATGSEPVEKVVEIVFQRRSFQTDERSDDDLVISSSLDLTANSEIRMEQGRQSRREMK
jgi:hypothetical protein